MLDRRFNQIKSNFYFLFFLQELVELVKAKKAAQVLK